MRKLGILDLIKRTFIPSAKLSYSTPYPRCTCEVPKVSHCCGGWFNVKDSLVLWQCGECHGNRHWGRYDDGPAGPAYPSPSKEEEEAWGKEEMKMRKEKNENTLERIVEFHAEHPELCQAQSGPFWCSRPAGHEGPHGHPLWNGLVVLAPW